MIEFEPRAAHWDAASMLDGVRRTDVRLTDDRLDELEEYLFYDLCAEYDAVHLHRYLSERSERFSPEFLRFEEAWWRDEWNHFRGFRALYALLYGTSADDVDARLARREPDFDSVEEFLSDEFAAAVLFAYDELSTTRAYVGDFDLYRSMGDPVFLQWIQRITRDESHHYQNAVRVLEARHADRLHEAPAILDRCVEYEHAGHPYRATFLFDHELYAAGEDFFATTRRLVLTRLDRIRA